MFEKILDAFLENPKRLVALGDFLITLGYWIGIAGLVGKVATTAVGAIISMANSSASVGTLADIYPSLPTAWVPESAIGFVLTGLILSLGLWLKHTGKQFERYLRY
jgi:hypothetical protein